MYILCFSREAKAGRENTNKRVFRKKKKRCLYTIKQHAIKNILVIRTPFHECVSGEWDYRLMYFLPRH
jgi:hypothetical protein